MPSKITEINKSDKIEPRFTCPYCGSHECNILSSIGRVAGRFEKRIICLKCKKAIDME